MHQQSFSEFLIGSASLERPSFFYAYSGMWLHFIISVPFLVFFLNVAPFDAVSSMAVSSLSAGIIVYSIVSREYTLLVNTVSYSLSMARAFDPEFWAITFLVIAIIIAFSSSHLMLASEYRRYTREVFGGNENGVPVWITVLTGTTLMLLFFYGIHLL